MVGPVGVDDVRIRGTDMLLEINTGTRFTLGIGQFVEDESGAVSYDTNVEVDLSFATIDFSKSSYVADPSQPEVKTPGYAIETGSAAEPIVLQYTGQYLHLQGAIEANILNVVRMTGVMDFTLSEDEGLTVFADVNVDIGTAGFGISSEATGLLVIRDGIAMRMKLETGFDLGDVASLEAELDLTLNSFGEEITYEVPEQFEDETGFATFTIPAAPPGREPDGMYVAPVGEGHLSLFGEALTLQGEFSIIITETELELGITATLDLPLLRPLDVTGTPGLARGEDGGLWGSLEVGNAMTAGGALLIDAAGFGSAAASCCRSTRPTSRAKSTSSSSMTTARSCATSRALRRRFLSTSRREACASRARRRSRSARWTSPGRWTSRSPAKA
ncbi:hypothetical protein HK414_16060 [Ramlibacter terrae]|uniref:Uncharacterized protein n=1 Tax=Ramlibacter terrae TaxID=2732511 RepID=A0ABX6P3G3_9BURK|nr:hypothetical protein HK414_16060 [Ramlibacter terrae]